MSAVAVFSSPSGAIKFNNNFSGLIKNLVYTIMCISVQIVF